MFDFTIIIPVYFNADSLFSVEHELRQKVLTRSDRLRGELIFVDDGSMPLVVHCTQGVSRSGAVGYVLDRWFNRTITTNEADHEYFMEHNPLIMPNPNVTEVFLRFLEL